MPGTRSNKRKEPPTNADIPASVQHSARATRRTPVASQADQPASAAAGKSPSEAGKRRLKELPSASRKRASAHLNSYRKRRARASSNAGLDAGSDSDSDASMPELSHAHEMAGGSSNQLGALAGSEQTINLGASSKSNWCLVRMRCTKS